MSAELIAAVVATAIALFAALTALWIYDPNVAGRVGAVLFVIFVIAALCQMWWVALT